MNRKGGLQVRIFRIDRHRSLRNDLERLEKRPIAYIVAEPGAVMDAVETAVEDHAGDALGKGPRGGLLESAGVE
ncbi:MAG TPA: hypothetical protein VN924_29350 [Bryobacteraceae bacterium]|nr:hypothetical protein [Bryobacteraceae bacterium]